MVPGVGERIPQHQKRMTSGTGKTREQVLAERRGLSEQAHHPGVRQALRRIAEVKAGTGQDVSGAMLPGVQVNAAIMTAVSAAVEATHAFYRRVLGDEAFFRAYARYQRGEADEWSPQDQQLTLLQERGGVVGGGSGDAPEAVAPDGESTEDNQPAGSQAGAGTPGGGSGKEDPPSIDPPPPRTAGTRFPCPQCEAAGVEFTAGSELGLKAHQRARHKDA